MKTKQASEHFDAGEAIERLVTEHDLGDVVAEIIDHCGIEDVLRCVQKYCKQKAVDAKSAQQAEQAIQWRKLEVALQSPRATQRTSLHRSR